jgi:acetyl-CoA carboxylase biotin carboxyl carrier protein
LDLKLVEQLLALMKEGGLTELHFAQGDVEVRLSRQPQGVPAAAPAPAPAAPAAPAPAAAPPPAAAPAAAPDTADYFRSPMVGTFYRRPNPESDNYVDAGDAVTAESVICLIEAMKVFNEIKAEFRGTILEVLVQDGETVEYNQPLFKIRK